MGLGWFGFEPVEGFAVGGVGLDIRAEGHEEGLVRVRVRVMVRARARARVRDGVRLTLTLTLTLTAPSSMAPG